MRSRALFDRATPAITSNSNPQPTIPGLMTRSELVKLVADQKATIEGQLKQITAIRRRHDAVEAAMAKYQSLLERTITEQREAFLTVGLALRPSPSRRQQQ